MTLIETVVAFIRSQGYITWEQDGLLYIQGREGTTARLTEDDALALGLEIIHQVEKNSGQVVIDLSKWTIDMQGDNNADPT